MRYRPPRVTTLLPDVYPPPPVDYYEAGLEPFGPQVDYEGEPVVYGPDYSATLEPVLEPGVLTEERDFWGNPAALAAPFAPVIGAAGIVGGATEPWSQSIAGEASAALQGNFDPFLGRREDGSQFSIQRELRGEVEGPTPGQEAYDTHSIPFVTGAIEAVADPLNALPVVGFGDDIARLTAKGAGAAQDVASTARRNWEVSRAERAADPRISERGQIRLGGGASSTPPPGAGSGQPIQPNSPLDRLHKMWDEAEREPTLPERLRAFREAASGGYRRFQELFTDRYAGLNALSKESEQAVALTGGIGDAQVQRARDISQKVRGALGDPWDEAERHLNDWLHLKQALDIAAVKGPARRIPGGIRGPQEAQQALMDLEAYLGPERWARLEAAGQAAVEESAATLNKLVDAGIVARELADKLLREYPHYNKQNILREVDEMMQGGVGTKRISVTSANLKRLTEEGTEKARTSPYASIIGSAADAEALIFRNNAARQVAEDAIAQGLGKRIAGVKKVAEVDGQPVYRRPAGEIPGTISYMENGERVVVEVPKWLERQAKAIGQLDHGGVLSHLRFINSPFQKFFVTYNPAWPAANLVVDYMTAAMRMHVSPLEEMRGIAGAVFDLFDKDEVLKEMRRSGAGQSGWFAKDPKAVARMVRESGNIAITSEPEWHRLLRHPERILGVPFKTVETFGQVLEQGTRRAVYQTAKKRGATAAEAALASRRTTIDFARGGELAKALNNISVFFNAGIQGVMILPRALKEPRALMSIGIGLGLNAALYQYNRQFPEYKDIPRDVRRSSLIVMLPSEKTDQRGNPVPRYLTVIPKMREWGLIFGTQTYVMEKLDEVNNEEFGDFLALTLSQATPIQGAGDFLTVPGTLALEQQHNYDFYRQRPIVPPELEGLPNEEQYDQYTSKTLLDTAKALGVSPMRLQHAFYGATGGTGRTATGILDALRETLNPTEQDFRIAELANELDQIRVENGVPKDEVTLRRTEFLSSLSAADQKAVMDTLRQPKPQVPVIGAMASRFYGEKGGEQYRLGQEAAEEVTGKDAKQTAEAGRALARVFDITKERQEQQDKVLLNDPSPDTAKAWREAHGDKAVRMQGAIEALGVVFPGAAQLGDRDTWRAYQEAVYTMAGNQPDTRTKGQLLAAAYRAIPLESIDPLTKDFDTFFQRRAEFKAAMSPEDQALLDRTIQANMTPVEKEYAKAQETLRPYWEAKAKLMAEVPAYGQMVNELEEAERTGNVMLAQAIRNTSVYKTINRVLEQQKDGMRLSNPELEKALLRWGYVKTPIQMKMAR